VRDHLDRSGWDREPPPPSLPPDVVEGTAARYREAYERITGERLEVYLARAGVTPGDSIGALDDAFLERLREGQR
jgi:hypothetical protein